MANRKKAGAFVVIMLLFCTLLCGFTSGIIQQGVGAVADVVNSWTYYNNRANDNDVTSDDFNNDRHNGDDNTYHDGVQAVNDGKVGSVLEYNYVNKDGKLSGEYINRINPMTSEGPNNLADPALLAQHCVHVEELTGKPILLDEQNEPVGSRADKAHLHFLEDRNYAVACYERLADVYKHASVSIVEVNDYTSAMYMWHNGLEGNKPAVIVKNTQNAGGHLLVFDLGDKGIKIRYRIECGYQPVDISYVPVPDTPPIPDNPEPQPDPPSGGDPEPTPEPEPEPTPTLEPKDPDAGYNGQHPDNPDTGGGPNTNNDTTVTDDPKPEQNSPDEYVAPAPPSEDKPSGGGGNDAPAQKPDASSGTHSGSQTVDHDNGHQETYTDPDTGHQDTGTVQAGDGRDHGDFAQHVDDHPATVEHGADPAPTTDEPSPGNDECVAPE